MKREPSPRRDMKLRRKPESSDELDALVKASLTPRNPFRGASAARPSRRCAETRQYIRARAPHFPRLPRGQRIKIDGQDGPRRANPRRGNNFAGEAPAACKFCHMHKKAPSRIWEPHGAFESVRSLGFF
jgi:hypothetical protein